MPIYQAQTKGKMYIGASKVKEAYLGNKLVYSSGKEVIAAKNAPPFLSAGWRTITANSWVPTVFDETSGSTAYYLYDAKDAGTQWIGENEILANFTIAGTGSNSLDRLYIFYLPTIIETNAYSYISAVVDADFFGDTSEGGGSIEPSECSRFSNNGADWTDWETRSTSNRSYKYAQVGYFFGARSESAIDLGYYFKMTQFTIH